MNGNIASPSKSFALLAAYSRRGAKRRRGPRSHKTTEIPNTTWVSNGIPVPRREYRIYPKVLRPGRKKLVPYRLDFAWPDYQVCVEIQGGVWIRGGHTRGAGYIEDRNRINFIAGELGWVVLEYAPGRIDWDQIRCVILRRISEKTGETEG